MRSKAYRADTLESGMGDSTRFLFTESTRVTTNAAYSSTQTTWTHLPKKLKKKSILQRQCIINSTQPLRTYEIM